MDSESAFLVTSFQVQGEEYFCEIKIAGTESLASVYDDRGNLRVKRRLRIPAQFQRI